MSCGWARRSRVRGRRGRLRPEAARRVGWRGRRPRVTMVASTCGVFVQKGGISRISRVRERGQGQRGGSGYRGYAKIGDSLWRVCASPAMNSAGLAASRAGGRREMGKEATGYL
jgi:hypothetical protein